MYARRAGRWAATEVAVVAPRQQGKTFALEVAALADLFLFGGPDQLIIWTAHLFPTANEAFIDLKAVIQAHDFLASRVERITEAAGNQGIRLVDGSRLKLLARSKSGGRGFSGSKVYLDEAFALDPAEMGSLLPTLSAQPDPQIVYGSSAGGLGAHVLRSLRDRGRAGGDVKLGYVEWAARPGDCENVECLHGLDAAGCVLDDRQRWREANTGIVRGRTTEEFIATERRSLPPTEFMRERLGWWEDPPDGGLDDATMARWLELAAPDAAPSGSLALGLDVSHDSRSAALVVFGGHVAELVEYRIGHGVDWVPGRVAELREKWDVGTFGVAMSGPVKALLPRLPEDTVKVPSGEADAACVALAQDVQAGTIAHRGQPALDMAAARAVRQLTGDGWRWSRAKSALVEGGCDISPLWALVIARHLAAVEPDYDVLDSFG